MPAPWQPPGAATGAGALATSLLVAALLVGSMAASVTSSTLPSLVGGQGLLLPWLGAALVAVLGAVALLCVRGASLRRRLLGVAILASASVLGLATTALMMPLFEARLWLLYLWMKLPITAAMLAATGLVTAWTCVRRRRIGLVLLAAGAMLVVTAVVTLAESGMWQVALMLLAPLLALLTPFAWTAAALGVLWLVRGLSRRMPPRTW